MIWHKNKLGSKSLRQSGLAAVEFALILPFLAMLMLAVAELGRLLYQYTSLTKATQDGARYVASRAYNGTTGNIIITAAVKTNARNLVVCGYPNCRNREPHVRNLRSSHVSVTKYNDDHIIVSTSFVYEPMVADALFMPNGRPAINIQIPLRTTVLMRAL